MDDPTVDVSQVSPACHDRIARMLALPRHHHETALLWMLITLLMSLSCLFAGVAGVARPDSAHAGANAAAPRQRSRSDAPPLVQRRVSSRTHMPSVFQTLNAIIEMLASQHRATAAEVMLHLWLRERCAASCFASKLKARGRSTTPQQRRLAKVVTVPLCCVDKLPTSCRFTERAE